MWGPSPPLLPIVIDFEKYSWAKGIRVWELIGQINNLKVDDLKISHQFIPLIVCFTNERCL